MNSMNNHTELAAAVRRYKDTQVVPEIGQLIDCNMAYIRQDEAQPGRASTAMTKIRFIAGEWKQVPQNQAGMYVFFNNEPEVMHSQFRVTSVIPSRAGCYADLI
jgi:hypothetical protein